MSSLSLTDAHRLPISVFRVPSKGVAVEDEEIYAQLPELLSEHRIQWVCP
jgi:hypothetical protein